MTNRGKYEALIKWFADNNFSENRICTNAFIDEKMKDLYPELITPSGDGGLVALIDELCSNQHLHWFSRIDEETKEEIKCYVAEPRCTEYANYIAQRDGVVSLILNGKNGISPNSVLDAILNWFSMEPFDWKESAVKGRIRLRTYEIGEYIIKYYFPKLNSVDFIIDLPEILEQLTIDGYLIENKEREWDKIYSISFKGKIFSKNGGYSELERTKNAENIRVGNVEKRQRAYESNMVRLTWILAIGTTVAAIYYLLEIIKHHVSNLDLSVLTSLSVFLYGIVAGIIIYMLISEVLNRKNNG